jgi:hypothetical protein
MKRRRPGKNVAACAGPRFRAACHSRAHGGCARKRSPLAVEPVQLLSGNLLPNIRTPLVIRDQRLALCPPLEGKVYRNFLGRGDTCKYHVINILRCYKSAKAVNCVGTAYKIRGAIATVIFHLSLTVNVLH